ncbi:MAG: O-antigen ligase family protein [Anaerolineales bacterium]|nr:O-antigen ligase family protein [Anaerolineales bacterium]
MIIQPLPRTRNWLQVLYGAVGLGVGVISGMLVIGVPDALKLFVIVVGVFAFTVSLARVDWGLLVLIFITYTRFSDVAIKFHGAPSVAKSFILLLLLAIIARWIVFGDRPEGWQKPLLLMIGYGVVGLASILYAADPQRTIYAIQGFVKDALIVVIVAILMRRPDQFRNVAYTLLGAGVFLGTLSIIQFASGDFGNNFWGFAQAPVMHIIGDTNSSRTSGPFGNPNDYSQIMLVLFPLALDRLWNEKSRWLKIFNTYAAAVVLGSVILTFSRSGFVSLVLAGFVFLVYYRPKFSNIVPIMLLGFMLIPFVPREYADRMGTLSLFTPGSNYNPIGEVSLRGRTSEMLVGWMMFLDRPIFGVGVENYPVYYQEYSRRVGLDPRTEARSPHNLYLEVLAERGLLGFAFFMLILWMTYRGLREARRDFLRMEDKNYIGLVTAFSIGVLSYFIGSIFMHSSYPRFMWLLVGISLALPQLSRAARERHKKLYGLRFW